MVFLRLYLRQFRDARRTYSLKSLDESEIEVLLTYWQISQMKDLQKQQLHTSPLLYNMEVMHKSE